MKNGSNFFLRIALTIFIIFNIFMIVQLQLQFNELKTQKQELEADIKSYKETIAELNYELKLPYDDNYVKSVAREKLNYHLPDEIVFYNDLNK